VTSSWSFILQLNNSALLCLRVPNTTVHTWRCKSCGIFCHVDW